MNCLSIQLVEQSAASKLELAMAERKLAARNERLKFVEQQLVDASQAVSKRELEHKLQHARWVFASFIRFQSRV